MIDVLGGIYLPSFMIYLARTGHLLDNQQSLLLLPDKFRAHVAYII